jgi:hypothetical protein
MSYDLTSFEQAMTLFANRVGIVVALEVGNKMSPDEAYKKIKEEYKQLKKLHKKEKND